MGRAEIWRMLACTGMRVHGEPGKRVSGGSPGQGLNTQYSQMSKPVQSTVCLPKELLATRDTPVPVASRGAGMRGPPARLRMRHAPGPGAVCCVHARAARVARGMGVHIHRL